MASKATLFVGRTPFNDLISWFRDLVWSELTTAKPSEFTAVEVANLVSDRLVGRFKARGNRFKIVDQGGWLFNDVDWLEAALQGMLVHACDSTKNQQIELRITRWPASPDRASPTMEYHVIDAGPGTPDDLKNMIEHPFHLADGVERWPIALVVAARIAPVLGGELRIEPRPGDRVALRLSLPTRLGMDAPPVDVTFSDNSANVAPIEETVAGWKLGAQSASPAFA